MKKIEVTEIIAYSWTCTECGQMHITDKYANLVCENCGVEFEIEHVNQ